MRIKQLEAKDIVLNKITTEYKGTLDNSLELIKLQEVAKKVYRNSKGFNDDKTDTVISVKFTYSLKDDENKKKTKLNRKKLREKLYDEGFTINNVHYVRYKRSNGSSRVGKCLFIDERLYKPMMKWSTMGLKHEELNKVNWEAYSALTLSGIIDTITIEPKNILVIKDYESVFTDKVMTTCEIDGQLVTAEEEVEITNKIWDGQSLLDSSLFAKKYSDKGMLLLRNRMFKSACFNTNIQQFFKDNNITDIAQLNGDTMAQNVSEIKLITTKSSIKYLKFGSLQSFLEQTESTFGVVKYDKPTHFNKGKSVQTHYQLLNTLQFNYEETEELLESTVEYIKALKTDLEAFKEHIKVKQYNKDDIEDIQVNTSNDLIYYMLSNSVDFENTRMFRDFRRNSINAYINNVRRGCILVDGNYSTLFGNPLEMLKKSCGLFNGTSSLVDNQIVSTRFEEDTTLLGSRSPHITMGDIFIANNVRVAEIEKYFNLSKQIVCVNSINHNLLNRLQGADFDSDTMLLTDNKMLINKAKANYDKFLVPTNLVNEIESDNNDKPLYEIDYVISSNRIGEIVNLSQICNSIYWQTGDIEAYKDACTLSVMSGLEIDKAKRTFNIDNIKELKAIRDKYKADKPMFMKDLSNASKTCKYKSYDCTMDYLNKIINEVAKERIYYDSKVINISNFFVKPNMKHYRKKQHDKVVDNIKSIVRKKKSIRAEYKEKLNGANDDNKEELTKEMHRELYKTEDMLLDLNLNIATIYMIQADLDAHERNYFLKRMVYKKCNLVPMLPTKTQEYQQQKASEERLQFLSEKWAN